MLLQNIEICGKQQTTPQKKADIMKNILLLVAVSALVLASAQAKDKPGKMQISIVIGEASEVRVQDGLTEYVYYSGTAETPAELTKVRVWHGSDSLWYNLTCKGADFSNSAQEAPKKEISVSEAAMQWAGYLKKFDALCHDLEVSAREPKNFSTKAKTKIGVVEGGKGVSMQVGPTEYVFRPENSDGIVSLLEVKVWKGADKLVCTLTAEGAQGEIAMSRAEAAEQWAKQLKKFEEFCQKYEVTVFDFRSK